VEEHEQPTRTYTYDELLSSDGRSRRDNSPKGRRSTRLEQKKLRRNNPTPPPTDFSEEDSDDCDIEDLDYEEIEGRVRRYEYLQSFDKCPSR
jgi:hypothetical protein